MKFYVHGEDPEITVVVIWSTEKTGTIQDVLKTFCENLGSKYPALDKERLAPGNYIINNARGKQLAHTSDVSAVVKHMDDLYVAFTSPNSLTSNKPVEIEKTAAVKVDVSNEKDSDKHKKLESLNNAALIHFNNERYRKAIQIYNDMLALDEQNKDSLIGLALCYLKANRAKKALQYAEKVLKCLEDDRDLLLIVGRCFVAVGNGDAAIEKLMHLIKIIRKDKGTSAEEKQEIQLLLAKAYMLKDQKDMAITILQGLLRENLEHSEALVEYAALLYSLGPPQFEEAMTVLLTVLARNQHNTRVREVFATICTQPNGMDTLKKVAGAVWNDVSALLYLAICLKECSAVKESLDLVHTAYTLEPGNPSTALIYVHTLELFDRNVEIVKFYKQYFSSCPDRGIAQLTCAFVNSFVSNVITSDLGVNRDELESRKEDIVNTCCEFKVPSEAYSGEELYFLALLCTLIKILYFQGLLPVLPPLLAMVKPFCTCKDLHLTDIRNEVAFYSCIQEVFNSYTEVPNIVVDKKCVYLVGDSHCIPAAWHELFIKDEAYMIRPILSTGTKIWHLREESKFYPKVNFYSSIKNIPDGAIVIFCLGEIDCREAFLRCWEKARYDKIEDAMLAVTQIYIGLLNRLREVHKWHVFVHPVLPVLDITRPIVMQFNRILATHLLADPNLKWLNFVNELIMADESSLKEEFKLDGTHIHPRYVDLLSQAISVYF